MAHAVPYAFTALYVMIARQTGAAERRALENLGISEPEELVYRWLLKHRGAAVSEAAQALALVPSKAQRLLDSIEAKGLATRSPERPRRYIPASPDIALGALFVRRQKDMQDTQSAIQELQKEVAAEQHDEHEQIVELITSRKAERQVYEQILLSTQDEVVSLVRTPMLISQLDIPPDQNSYAQRKSMARGVHYRGIVDSGFLELPGAWRAVVADIKAGEEIRAIPHLPIKLVLADHRIALIPLNFCQPDGPSLLVRSSALLDALYAMFEMLWERASPISFSRADEFEAGDPGPPLNEQARELISLMAAGLNDKSMSYELGVTTRTLQRRVTELMQTLGARTRFQVGWLAALNLATAGVIPDVQLPAQKQPLAERA